MAYRLKFLQVLINVASVDATEPFQFAPIGDPQGCALALNSILIPLAHPPHVAAQAVVSLLLSGPFVNEIRDRQYTSLLK